MPYSILKTDGSILTTVIDGSLDKSSSITLIGKGYTSYGTIQNDNFVRMLENFYYDQQPVNPIPGQIWFDSAAGIMRPLVNDGSSWRPLGVTLYSTTSTSNNIPLSTGGNSSFPLTANQPGDFWFKSDDQQLYVQTTSSGFVLIGPERAPGFLETRFKSTSIADSTGVKHAVMQLIVDGETVSILSNKTFASTASISAIGFPTIHRGITFKNYNSTHRYITTSTDVGLYGINSFLDTTYPQNNQVETITSQWEFTQGVGIGSTPSILNNDGSNNLSIASAGGNISLFVNGSTGVASFLQEGIAPAQDNRQNFGTSNYRWQTVYSTNLSAGNFSDGGTITGQWQLSNQSGFTPFADLSNDLGASTLRFNNVYAGTLNSGLQNGVIAGPQWKLAQNTLLLPYSDTTSMLGAPGQRFSTVHASGLDAGLNNSASLIGDFSVSGNLSPNEDAIYDLGSPGLAWNTVRAKDLQSVTAEIGTIKAAISKLTNSDGTIPITQFDDDDKLTADAHDRIPTQYAVRSYIDTAIATLITDINSLAQSLNDGLNGFKGVPAGAIFYHAASTPPDGYYVADGRELVADSYRDLFAAIGYTYGQGQGGRTFFLPDLRGQFVRGWDFFRGIDPDRSFASNQNSNIGAHQHDFRDVWMIVDDQSETVNTGNPGVWGGWNLDGSYGYPAKDVNGNVADWYEKSPSGYVFPLDDNYPDDGGSNDNTIWTIANRTAAAGDGEVRPTNVALLPIIKIRNGN